MSRSICRLLVLWATALVMLAPPDVWAGTPYTVHWVRTEANPACETADLEANNGVAIFHVNDTPLPTYDVPGALVTSADGSASNTAEAGFDSVLLSPGANDFFFGVSNSTGNNACVHAHEVVNLVSAPLGLNKPLFDVQRDGTAFIGSTQIDLSLAEINPPLARDIANLEAAIEAERKTLIANAAKTANLAAKLSTLQQLDTELADLVKRPLDEITQEDLDAILDRYADVVDGPTKDALDQLLKDLEQSVTDLQNELASLIDNFGAQADAVADFATQAARDAGFNPDDPSGYGLGPADVPWVDIPDISKVAGAFTPGNDPYDAYADAVIAALSADVSGGMVVSRAGFAANVRAWRANQAALQQALAMRASVSQAETNAFLNAQNKVTSYVRKFMDASDWFTDSPVPADVRAGVDGALKNGFGADADEMKDGLNAWDPGTLDLTQTQLCQTISAFAGAMSTIGSGFAAYGELMITLVHATTRIGVGFVPYVGPALDLCEAVTGKSWCLPNGDDLSTEQRIFSAAGVAVSGVAKFWGGAKNAAIAPAAKLVAEDMTLLEEELAIALRQSRRTWYKTLRGAVSPTANEFERKAALYLMKDEGRAMIGLGDDGVRKVLGIPKSGANGIAQAPDFLTATKGNGLALSEAKSGKIGDAVDQLTNAVKKLKEIGLAGDLERVEIVVQKGADLGNNNYKILNGYLFNIIEGKPVAIDVPGITNLFVRVIAI